MHSRHVTIVAALVAATALLIMAGGLAWRKQRIEQAAVDRAVAAGDTATARVVEAINTITRQAPSQVGAVRDELQAGTISAERLPARLAQALDADEAVTGYGVAFERSALPGGRLLAPYVERATGRGEPPLDTDLGTLYDYTDYKFGWYRDALLDGEGWMETNIFPDTGDLVALYAAPFILPGSSSPVSGVVFAAVSLEALAAWVGSMGDAGYFFVLSRDGRFLVHPREELVHNRSTIFTTAWESGDTVLHNMAVKATQGEASTIESQDEVTGRANWMFARPLQATGWSVFAVLFGDRFAPDSDTERRQLFLMAICALAGVFFVACAGLAYRVRDDERFHWAWTTALTLVLGTTVTILWAVSAQYPPSRPEQQEIVLDEAAAHQYVLDTEAGATASIVPTGVFVRSLDIESGDEVSVAGYIWQRFEIGRQDQVPRGFALPETFDAGRSEVREVFTQRMDGEEFIGWEFKATFRQRFDYGTFPFDRQSVWVRLRPESMARNVVFVPDYGGYEMMNPAFRPGVDSTIIVAGWNVIGSYFDYRLHSYNATLGLPGGDSQSQYPELFFNVELQRRFLGPFVTYIVPLGVTAAMLFALLTISSRREASEGMLGFSASEIVLGAAALFFVASFQHTALRDALRTDTLMYFEFFYFGLYLLIMAVSINAILFASSLHIRLIEYHDNLIPKLAFWPVCLLAVFLLTLVRFY